MANGNLIFQDGNGNEKSSPGWGGFFVVWNADFNPQFEKKAD
jgi:hypothetical protein